MVAVSQSVQHVGVEHLHQAQYRVPAEVNGSTQEHAYKQGGEDLTEYQGEGDGHHRGKQ